MVFKLKLAACRSSYEIEGMEPSSYEIEGMEPLGAWTASLCADVLHEYWDFPFGHPELKLRITRTPRYPNSIMCEVERVYGCRGDVIWTIFLDGEYEMIYAAPLQHLESRGFDIDEVFYASIDIL